jgi:hypothetical protein
LCDIGSTKRTWEGRNARLRGGGAALTLKPVSTTGRIT